MTLQAVPPPNRPLQKSDLDRSVEILRDRVDRLGVAEPEIRKQGDDQIVIDLPGVKDPDRVIGILGQTAQLELFDLEANLAPPSNANGFPAPKESLYELLAGQQALVEEDTETTWYLFDENKKLVAGPVNDRDALLESEVVAEEGVKEGELPKGWKIFGVPPGTVVVTCGVGEVVCPGVGVENPKQNYYYLLNYDPDNADPAKVVPEMTGADLKLAGTRQDFDTTTGEPIVTMQFTDEGGDKFGEITNREADRGRLRHNIAGGQGDPSQSFQHFAIVLDRQIKSWPSIDFEQYPNGIGGTNGAQITGIGSLEEAKDLALVLQSGALPVTFKTLETTAISATLGKDSLAEAWKAAIAGLIAVALFLLIFYRVLGVVAVIGLLIYAAFLYAAILVFNVTLTLPGFAGMILTLGVAADANIVIFERVKEEYRAGKNVRAAISAGYGKGFSTIIDANVVTAITATVLFLVATAGVKGFALMLLIGTLISLLTAVAATRAILGLLAGFKWFDNPKLMGAEGEPPKWIRRDFIGLRKYWFGISAVVVAISLLAIGIKGLNLGIDFEGGTKITATVPEAVAIEDVRAEAADLGLGAAQIVGRGETVDGKYPGFQIQTEELSSDESRNLTQRLSRTFDAEIQRPDRLRELRPPDRRGRDPRDPRLAPPDHDLRLLPLPAEVRGAGDGVAAPRRRDHGRDLCTARPGGDDRHGRRGPDRARVLDLRHDHHLRPHPREHPADEAGVVPDAGERLAVGDDPALARDDVHHAAADLDALLLRRRDAEGLRVRTARRYRRRCVLVDLHRRAAPLLAEGAGAGVRPPQGRGVRPGLGRRPAEGGRGARGRAADAGSDPGRVPARGRGRRRGRRCRAGACDGDRRACRVPVEARSTPPAAFEPPPWPGQITRSSRSASSSTSWLRSCAPASTSWPICRRRRASGSRTSSGSSAARSSSPSSCASPSSSTG